MIFLLNSFVSQVSLFVKVVFLDFFIISLRDSNVFIVNAEFHKNSADLSTALFFVSISLDFILLKSIF